MTTTSRRVGRRKLPQRRNVPSRRAKRELSLAATRAVESERKRISGELHDNVGQYLTALRWSLSAIRRSIATDEASRRKLDECARMVQTCMRELRAVSYTLHPPLLGRLGVIPAFREHAQRFSERSGLQIDLQMPAEMARLTPDTELALFRVFQECLSNVRRHAQVDSATVRLRERGRRIILEVEDHGAGFPKTLSQRLARGNSGIGLRNMRERLEDVGGTLQIRSSGDGTLVRATVSRVIERTSDG